MHAQENSIKPTIKLNKQGLEKNKTRAQAIQIRI